MSVMCKGGIAMDIPALSMAMAQNDLLTQVGAAMLGKSLDLMEVAGEGMTEMIDTAAMELSVNPAVGGNIDISV